jgi:hypothetical protein
LEVISACHEQRASEAAFEDVLKLQPLGLARIFEPEVFISDGLSKAILSVIIENELDRMIVLGRLAPCRTSVEILEF